eukprot:scaffold53208_cov37-Cyclotella_meneghiniana.AAC.6
MLRTAIQIDPGVFSERDEDGLMLLHYAAERRSPEFCKVIHDQNDTLVKTKDYDGWLPLHCACVNGNVNAAKYLYSVYPESNNIPDNEGWYLLHFLASWRHGVSNDNAQELLLLLLKHDKGVVSTPNRYRDLPLHYASGIQELAFTNMLFDAHPDGIFVQNEDGNTPVDNTRSYHETDAVHFFESQLEIHRQAQEDQERDNNGQLPIHRVLQNAK